MCVHSLIGYVHSFRDVCVNFMGVWSAREFLLVSGCLISLAISAFMVDL